VNRKGKRGAYSFFWFFLLLMGIVIGRYVFTTPYFKLEEVRVRGERRLSEDTILRWADIPAQECIFGISLREISRRIESNPRIKRAQVKRFFPSGLLIEVEEREPLAYLLYQNLLWEVDEEGIILGKADSPQDLPLITGVGSFSQKKRISSGIKIIKAFKQAGLLLCEVNVEDEEEMIAYLRKIKVYLGRGEHLEYLSYLPLIIVDLKDERISYIDLRFNGQVAVGLK